MVLVDTSIWIEAFRSSRTIDLQRLVDIDEIVCCLPIYQEVLQGFREEKAFRTAREAMAAMPMIESPLRQEVFDEAAGIYRAARRAGLTVRSGVDCLIAACALRHDIEVLHVDRDFDAIAKVTALRERSAR